MFTYIYEWMQGIAFYMVLMTAALHVLPENGYKKYIRFFTGLLLVVLLSEPLLQLCSVEESFYELYHSRAYRQQRQEIEDAAQYFKEGKIDEWNWMEEASEGSAWME